MAVISYLAKYKCNNVIAVTAEKKRKDKTMNTTQFKETIANLKQADLAAYKAGTKSNFVIDHVRNEVIVRAFKKSPDLSKPVTIEVGMTVMSYIAPSLALLSKDGQYPKLFSSANAEFKDGNINFTYKINTAGLSDDYRTRLNDKLNIKIPVEQEEVV